MAEIRTSLRVVDLPPREWELGPREHGDPDYDVRVATVAAVLEQRYQAGESLIGLSRAIGMHSDTVKRLMCGKATRFSVNYAYYKLFGQLVEGEDAD